MTDHQRIYAGIGSRRTPVDILTGMTLGAQQLQQEGWLLRSGHADGADLAFEMGAGSASEIHLPWRSYNQDKFHGDGRYIVPLQYAETEIIAAQHHPNWMNLSDAVRKLMCRNVTIVIGEHLDAPADIVICWTPGGRYEGGTAHGMRIADYYGIPVFNLGAPDGITKLSDYLWPMSPSTKTT